MPIPRIVRLAIFLAVLLLTGSASAVTPNLYINGSSNPNVASCSTNLAVEAGSYTTLYGTNTYYWTLYRNGISINTANETITCNNAQQCQLPYFMYSAPPVSAAYKVNLTVLLTSEDSNQINVTASSGGPTPMSRINGNATINSVAVCPGGPITLDASQSACASNYFASIELSDQWWNRAGGEFAEWLTQSEYSKYGPISAFDIKHWAEDTWFTFVPGQYYRVKLGIDPGWHERTQLIFIKTPLPVLNINGQTGQNVDILKPNYPIILNASSSTCSSGLYFLSVQLSDASWNRNGPEAMKWLTSADFNTYGSINQFDVKHFAQDRWFIFVPGQYYRVKLAVGPGWHDTSTLIYIKP
jgi:hypothetical protein